MSGDPMEEPVPRLMIKQLELHKSFGSQDSHTQTICALRLGATSGTPTCSAVLLPSLSMS